MDVSVVVPAYNASHTLEACLKNICGALPQNAELIVVDDGSTDNTVSIASKYTKHVISHKQNRGAAFARNQGQLLARGENVVFIDADIVIKDGTLQAIRDYFEKHPDVDVITGILDEKNPYPNFFSQYKNLYMRYIFLQLPTKVNFIYGSIYAARKSKLPEHVSSMKLGEDTELGQTLTRAGNVIHLVKELKVIHLKKHTIFSLIKNDFLIPFHWALLFIKRKGWNLLGWEGTGYSHASKEQLLSVALLPLIVFLAGMTFFKPGLIYGLAFSLLLWVALNLTFLHYLYRKRKTVFLVQSIVWTILDHFVMSLGIISGFISSLAHIKTFKRLRSA